MALVGPTASGKTALSLALAEQFGGEIVSCDSVAVYREFDVGTAKPSAEERARAPHHLIDIIGPKDVFTAGDYARLGREALEQIKSRGKMPIVVGGTGLYLRALLEGLFSGPQRSEELRARLRERVERCAPQYLHRILGHLDPAAAKSIHPNDTAKIIRAVEVCLASGRRMSELWKGGREPLKGFRVLRIGLDPDRAALYEHVNARARRMFDAGLVQETHALLDRYGEVSGPLSSTGYKQAVQHLRGGLDLEQAIAAAQQAHRNYAKRQMTWFRREPEVNWLRGFGEEVQVQQTAIRMVQEQLAFPRRAEAQRKF